MKSYSGNRTWYRNWLAAGLLAGSFFAAPGAALAALSTQGWVFEAYEGNTFTPFGGRNFVRFGQYDLPCDPYFGCSLGRWTFKSFTPNTPLTCNVAAFGVDPWPGNPKVCETLVNFKLAAGEHGSLNLGSTYVIYGMFVPSGPDVSEWFQGHFVNGNGNHPTCDSVYFGDGSDPYPNVAKACFIQVP